MSSPSGYPTSASARDRWVVERRPDRSPYDPWSHQGVLVEDERQADGRVRQVATVFLTGRECPWRCAMCDLWRYTTTTDTPAGAIAAQVASARAWLASNQVDVAALKLYNAGSFFDPRAVPEGDYDDVAAAVADLSLIVVECHPSLVGSRLDRFTEALGRQRLPNRAPAALEVAMGLETAHPAALEQLNKRLDRKSTRLNSSHG